MGYLFNKLVANPANPDRISIRVSLQFDDAEGRTVAATTTDAEGRAITVRQGGFVPSPGIDGVQFRYAPPSVTASIVTQLIGADAKLGGQHALKITIAQMTVFAGRPYAGSITWSTGDLVLGTVAENVYEIDTDLFALVDPHLYDGAQNDVPLGLRLNIGRLQLND